MQELKPNVACIDTTVPQNSASDARDNRLIACANQRPEEVRELERVLEGDEVDRSMRMSTTRGLWNQNSSSEGLTITSVGLCSPPRWRRSASWRVGDLVSQLVYGVFQLCSDQKQQLQTWETTGGRKKKKENPRVFHTSEH